MKTQAQYIIALLITAFSLLALALFVCFNDRKNRVNRIYAIFIVEAFLWTFGEAMLIASPTKEAAIFWNRVCNFGIFFIGTGFTHFILTLLKIDNIRPRKLLLIISYVFSFLATGLLFTDKFLPPPVPKFSLNYFINPGPVIYAIFVGFWFCQVVYALYELYRAYKVAGGARRNQLKYLLIGALFGYIGGSGNYFLTFNREVFPINPYGTYGVVIYAIMMTYAILKFRLLDINVVLTRAGIFTVVYTLVLGIPFGIVVWARPLIMKFGYYGVFIPLAIGMALASAGPFIFMYLQRRAVDVLFKEQRRYQNALTDFSQTLIGLRNLDELVKIITSTIVKEVKVSFAAIYIKETSYNNDYQRKSCYPADTTSHFPEFITVGSFVVKALLKRKEPLTSDEIPAQDKIYLDSGLVIPCFSKEGLLAILILGAKPNHQMYTPDDLPIFENFGYASSMSIENCKFWKEIEEKNRQARIAEMDLFSYSVAHEIDNPMSIIKGNVYFTKKLLDKLSIPEDKRTEIIENLDAIALNQDRVTVIVKGIEDYGKKTPAELVPLKLADVLEGFIKLYLYHIKYNGGIWQMITPDKLPYIRGIKQELMQILVNLSNNSLHAVRDNKQKELTLKVEIPSADIVRITFSDNGYGIPKANLDVIFGAFSTTKASSEGRGMGLYTVRKIIQKHNGKIWAESEGPGRGASFIIELPIAKDITEADFQKEEKRKMIF